MLRLPRFQLRRPSTIDEALSLLAEAGGEGRFIAGGTDLLPNMKHELLTPSTLIALSGISALSGVSRDPEGGLVIGAMTTIADVATNGDVAAVAPALAQATSVIAGPQHRRMGTIGGNVLLDTRCQWYNQTYFWRSAIGFCLKKDGTVCHVVAGGSRCVAAASNDTAPVLMTLGASLEIAGRQGRRVVPVDQFWTSDGVRNHRLGGDELLVSVRIPRTPAGHRGAYGKLRDRGAIDYPLLGVAVRLDLDDTGAVQQAGLVLTALAAVPKRISCAREYLRGTRPGTPGFATQLDEVADRAFRQSRPIENIPGDAAWRREMIRVYVRRTFEAAASGGGPVHSV